MKEMNQKDQPSAESADDSPESGDLKHGDFSGGKNRAHGQRNQRKVRTGKAHVRRA